LGICGGWQPAGNRRPGQGLNDISPPLGGMQAPGTPEFSFPVEKAAREFWRCLVCSRVFEFPRLQGY